MQKHFLSRLNEVMLANWEAPALSNYGDEKEYSFGDLAKEILKLETLFELLDLKAGDKIALTGRNCANWAVAYLAIAAYRGVVVSILQDFKAEDIKKLLVHSDSKALFVGPFVWKELQKEDLSMLDVIVNLADFSIISASEEQKQRVSEWDKVFAEKYPSGIKKTDIHFEGNADDLAIINYTSGSTGSPKGVMLNGRALSNNVEIAMDLLPVPDDCKRVVSILPLAHAFGQLADFLYPICCGCHIYYLTKTPTPAILLKALGEVKPYIVTMVPLVIEKIYKAKIAAQLSKGIVQKFWKTKLLGKFVRNKVYSVLNNSFGGNVTYFLLGGAALNPEVEDFLKDINYPLSIGYGMTECAPLISGSHPSVFKKRSCGEIVSNMEVKIDHPNSEGVGEVLVRGENVMLGYYNNEAATQEAFTKDGWMRTGDLGYLDNDNAIFLKGRNKSMILGASGQNIYPEDIENKLNNLEAVSESVVVEREGRLVALVFPDEQASRRMTLEDMQKLMKENLQKLNKLMPGYSQVSNIEIKEEPFEKTPKKSIKRFLYK
ncbi:MAG: AMP-binding protein [Paludibacteraceae bacterium]|nr:AMP-binding protein [Paludibacteraceae bacterium]